MLNHPVSKSIVNCIKFLVNHIQNHKLTAMIQAKDLNTSSNEPQGKFFSYQYFLGLILILEVAMIFFNTDSIFFFLESYTV